MSRSAVAPASARTPFPLVARIAWVPSRSSVSLFTRSILVTGATTGSMPIVRKRAAVSAASSAGRVTRARTGSDIAVSHAREMGRGGAGAELARGVAPNGRRVRPAPAAFRCEKVRSVRAD